MQYYKPVSFYATHILLKVMHSVLLAMYNVEGSSFVTGIFGTTSKNLIVIGLMARDKVLIQYKKHYVVH